MSVNANDIRNFDFPLTESEVDVGYRSCGGDGRRGSGRTCKIWSP